MKQEYETRISALCKRLQHLESEVGEGVNRPEGSRLSQVERQLAKQTELYNDQASRVTKLQLDYNKVLNDYHAQLEVRQRDRMQFFVQVPWKGAIYAIT